MTVIEFMKDVRFGGGRFWRRRPNHGWMWWGYWDLDQAMRVECGVTSAEARRALKAAKRNAVIDDPALAVKIAWFRWTSGQMVRFFMGHVVFVNRAGYETRRMTVEKFEKEYEKRIAPHCIARPGSQVQGGRHEED